MPQKTGPDNRVDWLALHLISGLGRRSISRLVDRFGRPERVFQATVNDLQQAAWLKKDVARRILARSFLRDPEQELRKVERIGGRVITLHDAEYPRQLRQIPDPPLLLYARGRPFPADLNTVAMVGSRTPTPYGLKTARGIAADLCRNGVGVVSGMARGIDTAAHTGALDAEGYTVAVMGTGLDRIYPSSNRMLHERIAEQGTLLTDFPLGTAPEGRNFPLRNRIISGLSLGVIVVEAAEKSGSLITASLALDQGREVFAVPGSVHSLRSVGCHFLLKHGAALADSARDVMDGLGLTSDHPAPCLAETSEAGSPEASLGEEEQGIYGMLGDDPVHVDDIVRASRLGVEKVLGLLTKMELTGLIEQLPGKLFVRA